MSSLEKPLPSTRPTARFRSSLSPSAERRPRMRHRMACCLPSKIEYHHWAFGVVAFFLVVLLFQAFLPGSPVEDRSPERRSGSAIAGTAGVGELDFGDGIKFVTRMLFELEREKQEEANSSALASPRRAKRFQLRKPKIALVSLDNLSSFRGLLLFGCSDSYSGVGHLLGCSRSVAGCLAAEDGQYRGCSERMWI